MPTTDYYNVIESAVIDLLRAELPAAYIEDEDKQITKSDDTHLDSGYDYFVIAYPGAFPTDGFAAQTVSVDWEIILDAIVRFNASEPEAWAALKAWRAELFYLFNLRRIGRTLDRTSRVENVLLSSTDRPRYIPVVPGDIDSGVAFIAQAMTLTVTEKINKDD